MQNHNDDRIKTSDTVLRKIYLSLYLIGLYVRGELETEQNCNILTPTLMAISVSFPFSRVAQPEARGPSSLLGAIFSTGSFLNLSDLQTEWLPVFTELYNISTSTQSLMHFRRLWNGMFDCHRAEITVMQFTGHSLPVNQFVTAPWDFNPIPYCQPSPPTPMEYALLPSLECHVWRVRRSIYNII